MTVRPGASAAASELVDQAPPRRRDGRGPRTDQGRAPPPRRWVVVDSRTAPSWGRRTRHHPEIARCLRRSGVDAVPATGAGERVDERPVGRGRSPATFAAQHLGSTCWPSSVAERRGRDQPRAAARRGGRWSPAFMRRAAWSFRPGGCLRRAPQRPRAPRDGVGVRRTSTPCLSAS